MDQNLVVAVVITSRRKTPGDGVGNEPDEPGIHAPTGAWSDSRNGVKAQKTRHPRWSELVNVVRKAKFGATDSEITAAVDAVLQAEAAETAAHPPVLALEV